jgi:hypothetical protein
VAVHSVDQDVQQGLADRVVVGIPGGIRRSVVVGRCGLGGVGQQQVDTQGHDGGC